MCLSFFTSTPHLYMTELQKINPTLTLVLISLKSMPYTSNSQLCCRKILVVRELKRSVSQPKSVMAVFYERAKKIKFRTELSQLFIYCAISYILRKSLSFKKPHNVT